MRGIGVCQSYACTYMYILNSLGIDCYFVPSDEMRHGWNIVRINGQLYHVDCTYDDPVSDRFGMASQSDGSLQLECAGYDMYKQCI